VGNRDIYTVSGADTGKCVSFFVLRAIYIFSFIDAYVAINLYLDVSMQSILPVTGYNHVENR
jgi:hypothetical protein